MPIYIYVYLFHHNINRSRNSSQGDENFLHCNMTTTTTVYNVCAGISIVASLAVLVTVYAFKNLRSKSFHFIMALAISDILFCTVAYISYLPNRYVNITLCRFEGWWMTTTHLAQAFVSVLVVDYLSRTLRSRETFFRISTKGLWSLFLALYTFAAILSSIPIFTNDYQMLPQGYCWIPGDTNFRVYFRFILLYCILWICLIYSSIEMAILMHYYNKKIKEVKKKSFTLAFENPALQESSLEQNKDVITIDSHHQSPTLPPRTDCLIFYQMKRCNLLSCLRMNQTSSIQQQDNMDIQDKIMEVIKNLRWYPVVDLIGWFPISLVRTIQIIQFSAGKPILTLPNWVWFVFLAGIQQLMGLGHAAIFFCNEKVRKTLREYISKRICQKKMDPEANLQPHAHISRESVELTSV